MKDEGIEGIEGVKGIEGKDGKSLFLLYCFIPLFV